MFPKRLILLVILIFGMFAGVYLIGNKLTLINHASSEGVNLSITPDKQIVKEGEIYNLDLLADTSGQEISGILIGLKYDPSKIEVQKLTSGDFFGDLVFQKIEDGKISASFITVPGKLEHGSGVLAHLTIKALSTQSSKIEFTEETQASALNKEGNAVTSATGAAFGATEADFSQVPAIVTSPSPAPRKVFDMVPDAVIYINPSSYLKQYWEPLTPKKDQNSPDNIISKYIKIVVGTVKDSVSNLNNNLENKASDVINSK